MQIGKAGVVAAGALATVAVMGSAASAAPVDGPAHLAPMKTAASTLRQAAVNDAMVKANTAVGKAGTAVDRVGRGPKKDVQQPLISIANSSSVNALAWQSCGSTSALAGAASVSLTAPTTVLGDCANANTLLRQDRVQGLISILDDSSLSLVPVQICGSNAAIAGATLATSSPATVVGDCYNANTFIAAPEGDDEDLPTSLVAIGSGSVVNLAATQICGSTASVAGTAVGVQSPTTVLGDCRNSNSTIQRRKAPALVPLLNNQIIDLVPVQVCASSGVLGQLGPALPINSPAFVAGQCASGQATYLD
ncbi:hypothetical protein [Catellatospora methionotrophica]|uniref:hypothetical protein n=1 Tax=Catellatospora methionotrophica TaxID=121620 RepID=UPI00340E609C